MTKCAKFELILLENQSIKYKDFIELIKNMKNDITVIKNKTIWGNYEFDNFTDDYIKKYNTKPEIGDILSYKMVSGYVNNQLKTVKRGFSDVPLIFLRIPIFNCSLHLSYVYIMRQK